MIPAFQQIQQQDREIQQLQRNVAETLNPLTNLPFIQGTTATLKVSTATPAGTPIVLNHGLGRTPLGVVPMVPLITGLFVQNVSFAYSNSSTPSMSLLILASSDLKPGATFSFWVF